MRACRDRSCRSLWVARVAVAALAAVCGAPVGGHGQVPATLGCNLEPGPTRAIAAIVDAETVRLDDGNEVRLIGALAPRARDAGAAPGTWPPEENARAALATLIQGRTVALAFGGRRQDRYGRVLAQLFLAAGDGSNVWVQGRLIEMGHARAYSMPESETCIASLLTQELAARAAGRGLWGNAAYQLRPADRPSELALYRDTFQIVRGRVERWIPGRGAQRLVLVSSEAASEHQSDRRSRQRFHIVLASRAKPLLVQAPSDLVGRDVRVRGWIEARAAPQIELISDGQLEVEAAAPATTPVEDEKRPADEPPGVNQR